MNSDEKLVAIAVRDIIAKQVTINTFDDGYTIPMVAAGTPAATRKQSGRALWRSPAAVKCSSLRLRISSLARRTSTDL